MASTNEIGPLFEAIDSEHNGFITRKTLAEYVKKNDLPERTLDVSFLLVRMSSWFVCVCASINHLVKKREG